MRISVVNLFMDSLVYRNQKGYFTGQHKKKRNLIVSEMKLCAWD